MTQKRIIQPGEYYPNRGKYYPTRGENYPPLSNYYPTSTLLCKHFLEMPDSCFSKGILLKKIRRPLRAQVGGVIIR